VQPATAAVGKDIPTLTKRPHRSRRSGFKKQSRSKTSHKSPVDLTETPSKSGKSQSQDTVVDLLSPWPNPAISAPTTTGARRQRVYGSRGGSTKSNTNVVDLVGHDDLGELLKQVE
jgi:hypothetical protein